MSALELKIPPLVVVLVAAALMWLVARAVPEWEFPVPARDFIAAGLAIAGVAASALGVVSFRRAGTTTNPMKPGSASSLVASGIYKRTRNPMYLGFLLALLGWVIYLSNVPALFILPLFVLYMNRFQIEPEERTLAELFGQEYAAYKASVRRWL